MPPSLTESSASVSEGAQTTTRRLLDTPPALGDMAGEPKVNRSTTFPMMLPRRNGALDDIDFVPCAQRDSANSDSMGSMESADSDVGYNPCEFVYMSGMLKKQNPNGILGTAKLWKSRFFEMEDSCLRYYIDGSKNQMQGEIFFSNVKSVSLNAAKGRPGQFEIATNVFMNDGKPRIYVLDAGDESTANDWVVAIQRNVMMFKQMIGIFDREESRRSEGGLEGDDGDADSTRKSQGGRMRRMKSLTDPTNLVKRVVSGNKKRYIQDGFDLDLSYVTTSIIAMGYPSEGMEGVYRNPFSEVYRFFETYHPDMYKIYNLCSERSYAPAKFHNRVECYPFDDHNAPPFELMRIMCCNASDWVEAHPKHVVAIHCKAGKGRTGCMVCSLLLHLGICNTAEEALSFYAAQRTLDGKGVTIRSQIRYVHYFSQNLNKTRRLAAYVLQRIVVVSPPYAATTVTVEVENSPLKKTFTCSVDPMRSHVTLETNDLAVAGDVKFTISYRKQTTFGESEEKLCYFSIHTSFESCFVCLLKNDLDGAITRDKKHEKVASNFTVQLFFSNVTKFPEHLKKVHHPLSGILPPEGEDGGLQAVVESTCDGLKMRGDHIAGLLKASLQLKQDSVRHLQMLNYHEEEEEEEEENSSKFSAEPAICEAVILFDYEPEEREEPVDQSLCKSSLCVQCNDIVEILVKDRGWWLGRKKGKIGWLPQRFCAEIVDTAN